MAIARLYNIFRAIFVLLDLVLVAVIVFVFGKIRKFLPGVSSAHRREKKIWTLRDELLRERFDAAYKKFQTGSPEAVKLSIIELDKLADDILKRMDLEGEHMADRLDQLAKEDLASLEKLWRAHRFRNRIVHEPDFEFGQREAERVISDYEAFFKEIEII